MTKSTKTTPSRIPQALLREAVERARERGDRDTARPQQIFAELACDAAFILRFDSDGRWEREWIEGAWPGHAAIDLAQVEAAPWHEYVFAEDLRRFVRHFEQTLRNGADRAEYRIELLGEDPFWVESAMRCVSTSDEDGGLRIYGTMTHVDARHATEEALRASVSDYRALVEQASDGIIVFDETGRILTSNGAAHELFAMTGAQLHAAYVSDLFHPEDLDADPLALENLASGMTLRSVRRLKRRGHGRWVWAELSARRLRDGRIQATARDITARIEAERRIRHLAYFDSLTSLPNRERFRELIEVALDRAKRTDRILALLFLDVDRFKQVNDSLGHSMGDELLVQIAERLRSAVRGSDSVGRGKADQDDADHEEDDAVSRLGGDEFTVLLQDLEHAQDAARVARRVLHLLSRPFVIGDREIFVGASVGIAVWPEDGACAEVLLRSADVAMYHAKGRGGNTYAYFNSSMNAASSRRLTLESALRHAIERDELHIEYQPMRAVRSGRVSAAEALLRWTDGEGARIGPDEFIPVAEETGLIVEMGEWVLRRACERAVAWRDAGFGAIRISVNVSVHQLRDVGFVNLVEQALVDTGLSADQLELEITESSILDESPNIVAAVTALTDMGIGFALDDFGTGYSSLSALQRFPIERLKIDRSFVAGIGDSESDEALTSAIVALARRLDHRVVAEGVETEEQARVLTELGCDELQGYLFSRPLAPEAFVSFLEEEKRRDEEEILDPAPGGFENETSDKGQTDE